MGPFGNGNVLRL